MTCFTDSSNSSSAYRFDIGRRHRAGYPVGQEGTGVHAWWLEFKKLRGQDDVDSPLCQPSCPVGDFA